MPDILKSMARPLYKALARTPLIGTLVRREMDKLAAEPWSAPLIQDFVHGECGTAYGITPGHKEKLVAAFRRNVSEIESGTSPLVHTVLAREILAIAPSVKGSVIECGVWKGASTASLSLICEAVGRRLIVCDSFRGLPDDGMKLHVGAHTGVYGYYKEGMFPGTLDEVRRNVERCGCIGVCEFVEGFFGDSLEALADPIAFAFFDVDLAGSMRDCLRYVWPLLVENGAVYCDDAGDMDVVRVFFDEAWWRERLGCSAPGFVGSGCGLPLNPKHSSIGYVRKIMHFDPAQWRRAPFLHYPGDGVDGTG